MSSTNIPDPVFHEFDDPARRIPHRVPVPEWLKDIPKELREAAMVRFWVQIAALYATPSGRVVDLAELLHFHPKALSSMVQRCSLTISTANEIEKLVGRKIVRREDLLNDVRRAVLSNDPTNRETVFYDRRGQKPRRKKIVTTQS